MQYISARINMQQVHLQAEQMNIPPENAQMWHADTAVDLPAGTGVGGTLGGGYMKAGGGPPATAGKAGPPGGGYAALGNGCGGCCHAGAPAQNDILQFKDQQILDPTNIILLQNRQGNRLHTHQVQGHHLRLRVFVTCARCWRAACRERAFHPLRCERANDRGYSPEALPHLDGRCIASG